MPVSIPTYLALRFVTNNSLKQRINFLQNSYKIQVTGFSIFSVVNMDKFAITKSMPLLMSVPL